MFSATLAAKPVAVQAGSSRVQRQRQVIVAAAQPEQRQGKAAAALFGVLSAGALLAGAPDAQALGNPYDYPGAPSTPEQAVQELKDAGKQVKENIQGVANDNNTNDSLYKGEKIFKKVSDIKEGAQGNAEKLTNNIRSGPGNAAQNAAKDVKNSAQDAADSVKSGVRDTLKKGGLFNTSALPSPSSVTSAAGSAAGAAQDAAESVKSGVKSTLKSGGVGGVFNSDLGDKARRGTDDVVNRAQSVASKGARDTRSPNVKPYRTGNDLARGASGVASDVSGAASGAASAAKNAAKSAFNKF